MRTADAPAASDHASAIVARMRLGIESVYTPHFEGFWPLRRTRGTHDRHVRGDSAARAAVAPRAAQNGTAASTTRKGWPVTQVSKYTLHPHTAANAGPFQPSRRTRIHPAPSARPSHQRNATN